jgi:hypothetical protein
MYRLTDSPDTILRTTDHAMIPRGHRWWEEYEEWLAEGNAPEPIPLEDVRALDEPPPKPIGELKSEKITDIESQRKEQERIGVTINGVRYAGDASNRQALSEAIQFAEAAGITRFARWKDSDGRFPMEHPVADVQQALIAIAQRRGQLIAREGELVGLVSEATTREDIAAIEWSFDE